MTKLKNEQMFAILFLLKLFWMLSADAPMSSVTLGGAVISTALQAILLVPVLLCVEKSLFGGMLYKIVCALYFLYAAARTLSRLLTVMQGVNIPPAGGLVALLLPAVVCVYGALLGTRALSRVAVLLFGMSLAAFAVLLLGAVPNFNPERLVTSGISGLPRAAWDDFCNSGGFMICAVLCTETGRHRARVVYSALLAQLAAMALVVVLAVGVLGRLVDAADYPFFSLCSFSQPFYVQRSDALFLVLYTEIGSFSAAYFLSLATESIRAVFPRLRGIVWWLTAAMLLSVWGMSALHSECGSLSAVAWLILLSMIPCIRLLRGKNGGAG